MIEKVRHIEGTSEGFKTIEKEPVKTPGEGGSSENASRNADLAWREVFTTTKT